MHRPVLDLVAGAHYQHVAHGLIGADRAVVDEDGFVLSGTHQFYAGKKARGEGPIVVVEQRAAADGARGRIERVVDEHYDPRVRIAVLVGEPHQHGVARVAGAGACRVARKLGVLQILLFIAIEAHVDRIERDQSRERRLPVGDEVAAGDQSPADAPGDGRRHAREGDVEGGGIERRLRGFHVGLRLLAPGRARVVFLLRDSMLGEETRRSVALGLGEHQLRARLGEPGARLVALRLVGARVDDEQHVALFDFAPLGEVDRGDVTRDARPDLDALHRLEAAGELIELRHLARDDRRDAHLWQGRGFGLGRLVASAAAQDQRSGRGGGEQHKRMAHGFSRSSCGSKRSSPPVGQRRGGILVFAAHSSYASAGEQWSCPPGGARLPRTSEYGIATTRPGRP